MKYFTTSLLLMLYVFSDAQEIVPGTAMLKKVLATEYNNGDSIRQVIEYTCYDSSGNILSYEKDSEAESGSRKVLLKDSPILYVEADVDDVGDTTSKVIYINDSSGQRIFNFQIRNGDTVVAQKREYDMDGNCIKIYNRFSGDLDYFLGMEMEYNDSGDVTKQSMYNNRNKLISLQSFEYKYTSDGYKKECYNYDSKKGFVKQYTERKEGNKSFWDYYIDRTGYNYGIKLVTVKGGHAECLYDDGELISQITYNKKGKLLSTVYITWEDVH